MLDLVMDAVIDCLKMLPFLFLAFLLMEGAERYYGRPVFRRSTRKIPTFPSFYLLHSFP